MAAELALFLLVAADYDLQLWNRTPGKVDGLPLDGDLSVDRIERASLEAS